ncbi:AMP-binding protein [Solwaraspora sp. WMMD406]|uniref:AMP-binding protein n=1 Tax=Solwaraspora sp. WMMD406 TaxID=3016095 RepID=UPI002417853E|nr:AMP-binding protein [Solwaraspora sp. WMMD406]MDG4765265.1 AMP-binding protein [Solwaraspora sp. WMMD406]
MPVIPAAIPLIDRFTDIADQAPRQVAFVVADPDGSERSRTFGEIRAEYGEFTARLAAAGVADGDVVVLAIENHIVYYSLVFAAWHAGAAVLPISPYLDRSDQDALLDVVATRLGRPVLVDTVAHARHDTVVVDATGGFDVVPAAAAASTGQRRGPVDADRTHLYMTSGGATGLPKVMRFKLSWAGKRDMPYRSAGLADPSGRSSGTATRLICGSLYHTGNFAPSTHVMLTGSAVITMSDFDPGLVCTLLRRHEVFSMGITPGHMMSVLATPDLDRAAFDRLTRVSHGAAPCPGWVKRGWIDLVGPKRLFEVYYSSELSGAGRPMVVDGEQWLRKPGTVGKATDVRILDADGRDVPVGEIGEIFVRLDYGAANSYVGDRELRRAPDDPAYVSVADLGWLDEDGYLFLADRMSETIDIGSVTVYPSRVEEVIGDDPEVADVAVVGLWTEDGRPYLHALVQPVPGAGLSPTAVRQLCRAALTEAEVPETVQFTAVLPRTAEGKMRRSVLRDMTSRDGASRDLTGQA